MTKTYFCVRHKNKRKHIQHLKLLWHIRLNIYMQEIKFTSHKQDVLGCLCSIKAKKAHTDQSTLHVLLLCSNQNNSQTSNSSSCKNIFLHCVCVIDATCFDEFFSFHVITGKHFFQGFVATLRFFVPPYRCFTVFYISNSILGVAQEI